MSDDEEEGLDGAFFRDNLSEMEERAILERVGRVAAEITIDIEDQGPLGLYVASRRNEAAEALRVLTKIDPTNAVAIAMAQSTVGEFLRVCEWIAARMDDAQHAQERIKREYDDHGENTDQRDD